MTLGYLIKRLEQAPAEMVVPHGFARPHSYRGYYEQLAFEPAENVTVSSMLACARESLGATYEGYKGGDYTMDEDTDVWLSRYGESSGERLNVDAMLHAVEVAALRAELEAARGHVEQCDRVDRKRTKELADLCSQLAAERAEREARDALLRRWVSNRHNVNESWDALEEETRRALAEGETT